MTRLELQGLFEAVLAGAKAFLVKVLLALVTAYRYGLSPLLGQHCRFQPSCSEYAQVALSRHGVYLGSGLVLKRLCRCHPWRPGGYDPVP